MLSYSRMDALPYKLGYILFTNTLVLWENCCKIWMFMLLCMQIVKWSKTGPFTIHGHVFKALMVQTTTVLKANDGFAILSATETMKRLDAWLMWDRCNIRPQLIGWLERMGRSWSLKVWLVFLPLHPDLHSAMRHDIIKSPDPHAVYQDYVAVGDTEQESVKEKWRLVSTNLF